MITVFIKSQAIDVTETVIVAESYNYLKAQFLFTTSDWNGLKKTAYFTQGETSHSIDLDENNIAYPIHLGSGTWSVCVVGKEYINGELVERITTDSAEITVKPFKVGKDTPFPEILPTESERIEAKIGDLSKLETKNKSDLVGAINEANSKTGGGSASIDIEVKTETEDEYVLEFIVDTETITTPNLKGKQGVQGEQGVSGVYVGSGEMPDGYNVQIDPTGEAVVIPTKTSQLVNDSGFITAEDLPDIPEGGNVDLSNYYTKKEIDNMVGDISTALDELHTYAVVLSGGEE